MRTTLGILSLVVFVMCGGCVTKRTAPQVSPIRPPAIIITNGPPEFWEYDGAVVNAIQDRWYDLLDNQSQYKVQPCKVVVGCNLRISGLISDVVVLENTGDEIAALMCQKAIFDSSPFAAWPEQIQKMVKENYRTLKFTFCYDGGPTNQMQRTR